MWYALVALAAAQAPPPLSPDARFAMALFCNPTCSQDVVDTLDEGLSSIQAKAGFPDSANKPIRIMGMAGTDFGIPDAAFVELYGVGVDRPEALAKSQEVLIAWIAAPRDRAVETLAVAHKAFGAAAKKGGGWVEDLDTQRLYGADAWAKLDPKGPITDWFVVDAETQDPKASPDDPNAPLRLVTRGLRRYGDFELVVENVPPEAAGDVSYVVNALAESLRKKPAVPSTLALATDTIRGTASFRPTGRRETDPEEPLLRATFEGEITVPGAPTTGDAPPTDVPAAPVVVEPPPVATTPAPGTNGTGAPPAPTPPAPTPLNAPPAAATPPAAPSAPAAASAPPAATQGPSSLDAARAQARDRFARVVRPAFVAGLAPGEAVAVKVPFRARDGGTEFMWVELRSAQGDDLVGVLMNDPYAVDGLKKGDTITLRQGDIFDYIWKKADGTREGNTTSAFLN
ncbi:MAG: DUF2314 domain-containing protein [Myxococcota bacterium]